MAISKMMYIKTSIRGDPSSHLKNAVRYILKDEKIARVEGTKLTFANHCFVDSACEEMIETKNVYKKNNGRQGYHFVISFAPGTASPYQVYEVAREFCETYLGEYQSVCAVHDDKDHVHAHIIFNSVGLYDGYKYHYKKGDWEREIQPVVDTCCLKHKLPVLEYNIEVNNGVETKIYSNSFNWNKEVKQDIDDVINISKDWETFIKILKEEKGYRINIGKYVSIKKPGMKKAKRLKSNTLGIAYTPEGIIERIAEKNGKVNFNRIILEDDRVIEIPKYTINFVGRKPYKKYEDLNYLEKAQVRYVLRIRRALPEYEKYPGTWYAKRNEIDMHNAETDLIVISKYKLTSINDIDQELNKLRKYENELKKEYELNEFRKTLFKSSKGILERDDVNGLDVGENILQENWELLEKQMNEIQRIKSSLKRLRKSELFEEHNGEIENKEIVREGEILKWQKKSN